VTLDLGRDAAGTVGSATACPRNCSCTASSRTRRLSDPQAVRSLRQARPAVIWSTSPLIAHQVIRGSATVELEAQSIDTARIIE